MPKKELSFEEALEKLETCAERISSTDITLDEAIKAYEEGAAHYEKCDLILKSAKQRIVTIGAGGAGTQETLDLGGEEG
ncbi:MAG: exodeoxyribonuclease VII small subunit [Clostridiales Family XIII bacterium]|jgi:exodeoxyribonuclease VII small subunit|nr:exodeoxyribonuclease VII small subunit [Clostridiales Family XIII bacterium]